MKQLFWAAIDGIKKEMSEEEKKASSLSSSSSTPPSVDKVKKSECSNNSNSNSNSKEEENSGWEDLYDDSEESMINKLSELSLANKKSTTTCECAAKTQSKPSKSTTSPKSSPKTQTKIDYLKFEPKKAQQQTDLSSGDKKAADESNENENNEDEFLKPEYSHIIEIYDFPVSFKNENIMNAFQTEVGNDNFCLKWVDDTHCLGIFSNAAEAQKALKIESKIIKARALNESSEVSKQMAKRKVDYLKPYKQRPQTSSLVANRLIGASLGIRMPKEKLDIEKNKLKLAKEKNKKDKELKESVWNGET